MKPELLAAPDKATLPCPNCAAQLHAPYPAWDIANSPTASIIVAVHQDDGSCITCSGCGQYLVPAAVTAQVQWTWVPAEPPARIVKPTLGLIKQ